MFPVHTYFICYGFLEPMTCMGGDCTAEEMFVLNNTVYVGNDKCFITPFYVRRAAMLYELLFLI